MFPLDSAWKWMVAVGLTITVLGLLVGLMGRIPWLNRLGSLPGDIRYSSPDGRLSCFVPIVSMILLSVVLSLVLNIIARIVNR